MRVTSGGLGDVYNSPLDLLTDLFADAVAFGLKAAAFFLKIALLLRDQLQFAQINGLASTLQLGGNHVRGVTHKALIKHGSGGGGAGSLWQALQRT